MLIMSILFPFYLDYRLSCHLCTQWHPEVSHFCPLVPLVLVGTKTDLRNDQHTLDLLAAQGTKPLSSEKGQEVAKRIGAKYAECSAKYGKGIKEVFDLALRESLKGRWGERLKGKKGCVIL